VQLLQLLLLPVDVIDMAMVVVVSVVGVGDVMMVVVVVKECNLRLCDDECMDFVPAYWNVEMFDV